MENNTVENFKNNEFKEHCSKYSFIPFIYPKTDRIVVFGDIHGDYEMAVKLFVMAKVAIIVKENKISRSISRTREIKRGSKKKGSRRNSKHRRQSKSKSSKHRRRRLLH